MYLHQFYSLPMSGPESIRYYYFHYYCFLTSHFRMNHFRWNCCFRMSGFLIHCYENQMKKGLI